MLATLMMEAQEFKGLVSPEVALAHGSSFTNLFIPYKYQTTTILKGNCERQNLIALLDMYSFMAFDLREYLDTHPNCEKAKEAIKMVNTELEKVNNYYVEKYGALCLNAKCQKNYLEGVWPWEDLF